MRTSAPTSIDGIEKYLSSGMIRGIGPVYAKKMVKAFDEKVFDIIEAEPQRLQEVTGIGTVRAKRIADAWADQKIVREIKVFLHSNGVGTAQAVRIYKTYGSDAVQVMTENPYRLARDIRGIGFKTADAIAMKLGNEKTAMIRVRAGISYALTEAMDDSHCGLPTKELVPLAVDLLEVPQGSLQPGGESDFHFVEADDHEIAVTRIVDLVQSRIPKRLCLDLIRDIQVLCPMNRGGVGARFLNVSLQAALNPAGDRKVERFGWIFAPKSLSAKFLIDCIVF